MNLSHSLTPLTRRCTAAVSTGSRHISNSAIRRQWKPRRTDVGTRRYDVPQLKHHGVYAEHGIPGVLSRNGYLRGWVEYQDYMCERLDRMTAGTPLEHTNPENIIMQTAREPSTAALFNYASMAYNNHFFYRGMTPQASLPNARLLEEIENSFSTLDTLRETLLATAEGMFGPGHVWLVRLRRDSAARANPSTAKPGFSIEPTMHILTTYLAGSPLPSAHWRRQPRDLNTANAAEPVENLRGGPLGAAPNANPPLAPQRTPEQIERMTTVQNSVGVAGPYAPGASSSMGGLLGPGLGIGGARAMSAAPLGGADLTPLLCVSTWQHVWQHDYSVRDKREYLEAWWSVIDWEIVHQHVMLEGFSRNVGHGLSAGGGMGRRSFAS